MLCGLIYVPNEFRIFIELYKDRLIYFQLKQSKVSRNSNQPRKLSYRGAEWRIPVLLWFFFISPAETLEAFIIKTKRISNSNLG